MDSSNILPDNIGQLSMSKCNRQVQLYVDHIWKYAINLLTIFLEDRTLPSERFAACAGEITRMKDFLTQMSVESYGELVTKMGLTYGYARVLVKLPPIIEGAGIISFRQLETKEWDITDEE